MLNAQELLLIGSIALVGVLHTLVPDHWVPITLIARQQGWGRGETTRAALLAGTGHVLSTLLIAAIVWGAGVAVASRFGQLVDTAASVALIAFGGWIALASLWEMRGGKAHGHSHHGHGHGHDHGHDHHHPDHAHLHRHGDGAPHEHAHDHPAGAIHKVSPALAQDPPLHEHRHKKTARTILLLILGSSPMVEGIPAFFAAGKYGIGLIALMAVAFAATTIATYVILCGFSVVRLQRVSLGSFERYGEALSGAFIALVGLVFWIWPVL